MALTPGGFHDPAPPIELSEEDRFLAQLEEPEPRTHFGAFLMGGLVVASGLLAFLYYDTDNLSARANRDFMSREITTGSIARSGTALDAPAPSIRILPPPPAEPSETK